MIKTIKVTIPEQSEAYNIYIGKNIFGNIPKIFEIEKYSQIFVLTDNNVARYWLSELLKVLPKSKYLSIPAGEKQKFLKTIELIWTKMHRSKCDRKSLMINLGGGVVSDLGGFAANTYMRGIDCLNIPTTLLSQVDASVGGKTGFNFSRVKNLVGTFAQPLGVVIDVNTLNTLPRREFLSGFAEIIKQGLVYDKEFFIQVTSKKPQNFSKSELTAIISKSCQIKAKIVAEDQTEKNIRKILNFGHTIGHAIESLSLETKHPLLHGEAVGKGIQVEAKISQMLGLITEAEFKIINKTLVEAKLLNIKLDFSIKSILEKIKYDKKNKFGEVKWVLLQGIGKAIYDQSVDENIVRESLSSTLTNIKIVR